MARMLGRSFMWRRDTRWHKRREARLLAREFAAASSWHDSTEGKRWLELGLAQSEGWPLYDPSDCQHGCNGSPCGAERCTFICHEAE